MRRAMSRPRPVDPALDRPRWAASGSPKPAPASDTTSQAPPRARRLTRTVQAAPSGVCANTFSSRMSAQAARSSRETATSAGPAVISTVICRSWSSASGRQNAARSAITSLASQRGWITVPPGRRASRMISLTVRCSPSTSLVSWARSVPSCSDSASIRSAVSGVRSRCERSAAVSRSWASNSPMRAARRLRPLLTCRISGGPATAARVARFPAASWSEACARARSVRTWDLASWSATATLSSSRPSPTPPRISQARVTPARSWVPLMNARITAVPWGSPCTATSTSTPPWDGVAKLRPVAASRTPADRDAGWPRIAPPGRNTVTGWSRSAALTRSTASLRLAPDSVATSGAIH